MKNQNTRTSFGSQDIMVTLTFYDLSQTRDKKIIAHVKGKTTEKDIGMKMVSNILSRFDITLKDFENYMSKQLIAEADEQRFNNRKTNREKNKIVWNRDSQGRIVSPFASKKFNKT